MSSPDISVVIPCYNAELFIDDCIGSVARQEGVEVEILAVDDRSTDTTWERLQALAATTPGLRLFRMERNGGQAAARNLALDHATGRFIALLDSDDQYVSPDVLVRWMDAAERDELELTVAQYSRLFSDGNVRQNNTVSKLQRQGVALKQAPELVQVGMSWQILFRKAFIDRHQHRFSDRLRQREDRLFFTQAFLLADRIGVTDIDAILYREHENSTMRRVDIDQLAQLNTHLQILAASSEQARREGRVGDAFLRANAAVYWTQAVKYWGRLLRSTLASARADSGSERAGAQTPPPPVARLFEYLEAITPDAVPLWQDSYFERSGVSGIKYEAVLDVARMAVAAGRLDIFEILLENRRVHHSKLLPLAAESRFDWAEDAAMRYLCFNRGADFEEEDPASAPPLAALVKKVVLHIGAPKTGSSSLQEYLERYRFELLDQGLWYPMAGIRRGQGIRRDRSPGHLTLMRQIINGNNPQSELRRLAAEIVALGKPVDTLVLSSENILSHLIWPQGDTAYTPKGDPFRKIARALGVDQIEVAVVLRRQDDWFSSYYREVVANPFNQFVAPPLNFFDDLDARGLFDYDRLIGLLETSPAVSRAHVTSFGALRAGGGSIPWFLRLVGLQDAAPANGQQRASNQSFSDAVAGNVRLMKLLNLKRGPAENLFREIAASSDLAASGFALVSHDEWAQIDARLRRYLQAFDARFPGERRRRSTSAEADAVGLPVLPALARANAEKIATDIEQRPKPERIEPPVAAVRRACAQISAENHYMKNSISWRVTAPLRKVAITAKALHLPAVRRSGEAR